MPSRSFVVHLTVSRFALHKSKGVSLESWPSRPRSSVFVSEWKVDVEGRDLCKCYGPRLVNSWIPEVRCEMGSGQLFVYRPRPTG